MILSLLFLFVLGAIIGSFLNVIILRLPKGEAMTGRSHCVDCGHELAAKDLVPVLSFILLRGRCRYCRKPISTRYLYVEIMTGLLFVLAFLASGLEHVAPFFSGAEIVMLLRTLFIISVLVVIFSIDYEHHLILDVVLVSSTVLLFMFNIASDYFQGNLLNNSSALIGLASGFALFLFFGCLHFFSNGRWMGFGDVKFAWFLGFATPFPGIVLNVFLAFMLGAVVGVILLAARKKKLKSEVPFGTFLALSSIITMLYGDKIIQCYMRLVGWS